MDSSPTSLFDSYEQDFKQIIQSISQKLDGDAKDERGGTCFLVVHAAAASHEGIDAGTGIGGG